MADTTYTTGVTAITADTMNDLNRLHYTILSDPADAASVRTALAVAGTAGATMTGLLNQAAGANIASAATVDLTTATGNSPRITGTTATSAFTMNTGQQMRLVADGAWPLTYNATTNKIVGGVSVTLSAGQLVDVFKDNSGIIQTKPHNVGVSSVMSFCANAAVADGTTNYMSSATTSTSETDVSIGVPFACIMKNLYVSRSGGGSGTATFTLRKNSSDTALTAAPSGAGTAASDTSNTVTFAAGDTVNMKVVLSGGATTAVHKSMVEVVKI